MTTATKRKPTKTAKTKTTKRTTTKRTTKAKVTLLSFILDETGSMESHKIPTISGFNEYLNTMKKQKGTTLFTLTKFNTAKTDIVQRQTPIQNVPELNNETYVPNHGTPLYDAIGRTINSIDQDLKARKDKPAVLVTIMTDGEENSSKEFTRTQILDLIKAKTKEGWVFTYLGANQDAWAVGSSLGISTGNSMTYDQSQTKGVFAAAARGVSNYVSASVKERRLISDSGVLSASNMELDDVQYKGLTGGVTPPKS